MKAPISFFTGVYTRRPQAGVEYLLKPTVTQPTALAASQVGEQNRHNELSVGPGGIITTVAIIHRNIP